MNTILSEQIALLNTASRQLLRLGMDGSPVYCDDYSHLNGEVYRMANDLYLHRQECVGLEEEAICCQVLLTAYNSTFCDYGDKQICIQQLLTRSWYLLEHLPATALKVRLLLSCYAETYDDSLLEEALSIVRTWADTALTPEQAEALDCLESVSVECKV